VRPDKGGGRPACVSDPATSLTCRSGTGERRLRQLGLLHVASDADPPDALVERARTALAAEPDPDDEPHGPDEAPAPPDGDTRHVLAAVRGPKGGPGRTTVAVNLAFEAATGGEVLLVDADTYGGAVAHAIINS